MKTIEELIDNIYQELDVDEVDKKPGSDLYSIVRAVAKSQYDTLSETERIKNSLLISRATSKELDNWGSLVSITRKEGTTAEGSVLAVSDVGITISSGTLLTDLSTGNQFRVTESVSLEQYIERRVPITALRSSPLYNLRAGYELYSEETSEELNLNLNRVQFKVGSFRTTSGEICGDITGGSFPENDLSLRSRIKLKLSQGTSNSVAYLKSLLLSEENIIWVDMTTSLPGMLLVYIETISPLTDIYKNYLNNILENNITAGIVFDIIPAPIQYITININVSVVPTIDVNKLINDLRQKTYYFLLSLSIKEKFSASLLSSFLIDETDIFSSRVTIEESIDYNKVLRPSQINVIYEFN